MLELKLQNPHATSIQESENKNIKYRTEIIRNLFTKFQKWLTGHMNHILLHLVRCSLIGFNFKILLFMSIHECRLVHMPIPY